VHRFPPPIYTLDGEEIKQTLIARRNGLYQQVMDYYHYISGHITISGSDEKEVFKVSGDGKDLLVTISATIDGKTDIIYSRKIMASETRKITLSGLGGNDTFIVDDAAQSPITLYLQGGAGADIYDIKGSVKNNIIDNQTDNNQLLHTSKSRLKWSKK